MHFWKKTEYSVELLQILILVYYKNTEITKSDKYKLDWFSLINYFIFYKQEFLFFNLHRNLKYLHNLKKFIATSNWYSITDENWNDIIGQLTKSIVFAYVFDSSSHHVSHHSHSCGRDFIATWCIILFGKSCQHTNKNIHI